MVCLVQITLKDIIMRWIPMIIGIITICYSLYCEFKARYLLTERGKEKIGTFFLVGFFLGKSYFTTEGWKYRVRAVLTIWIGTLFLIIMMILTK